MAGPLATIGAAIVGGLFGKSGADKDAEMQWAMQKDNQRFHREMFKRTNRHNNPRNIRKRAERAGFNPLAFIGAGVGNASFSTPYAGTFNPVFSDAYSNIGRSITDATAQIQAYEVDQARLEMENQRLQMEVEDRMLKENKGGIYGRSDSGTVGTLREANRGSQGDIPPQYNFGTNFTISGGLDGATAPALPPEVRAGHVDTPYFEWLIDKRYAPTQIVEDEYGDLVAWVYGVAKAAHDVGANVGVAYANAYKKLQENGYDPKVLSRQGFEKVWQYLNKETEGSKGRRDSRGPAESAVTPNFPLSENTGDQTSYGDRRRKARHGN